MFSNLYREIVESIMTRFDFDIRIIYNDIKADIAGPSCSIEEDGPVIFLPEDIEQSLDNDLKECLDDILTKKCLELSAQNRAIFCILHEIGHAVNYIVDYGCNYSRYTAVYCILKMEQTTINSSSLSGKEKQLKYWELPMECDAQKFALEHIQECCKL